MRRTGQTTYLPYLCFAAAAAAVAAWRAANAAGKQATLLEKQVRNSAPRPIIVLTCDSRANCFEVENVGDDLAFALHLTPTTVHLSAPKVTRTLRITDEPLVRFNKERLKLRCEFNPPERMVQDSFGQPVNQFREFLLFLKNIVAANEETSGVSKRAPFPIAIVTATYRNIREEVFSMDFVLYSIDEMGFECRPSKSRIEHEELTPR